MHVRAIGMAFRFWCETSATFGVSLNWDVFGFGKRRGAIREREAQLAQAEEDLERLKEEVAVGIEGSYNKMTRTKNLVEVANRS
jgi:outer membrane protein TolC